MKKLSIRSVSVALATLVAATAVTVVSPQAAQADPETYGTGSWAPQNPSTFKIPKNWQCNSSHDRGTSVAQNCLVRSGDYVQPAMIIKNLTYAKFTTRSRVQIFPVGLNQNEIGWECRASMLAPRGLSVCFGATTRQPKAQVMSGLWFEGGGFNRPLAVVERPR